MSLNQEHTLDKPLSMRQLQIRRTPDLLLVAAFLLFDGVSSVDAWHGLNIHSRES